MMHLRQGLTGSLLVALLASAMPVAADMHSAAVAYEKGDLPSAFQQFKEMAELGEPRAQLNLSILYANGKGVMASNVYAHAWASLAGQNGIARGKELADELQPQLTPTSLQLSADIQNKYSPASLNTRLLPNILQDRDYQDRDPVKLSKPFMPSYPEDAEQHGVQGEVFVEFTVAPDGHARLPRILYAVPLNTFDAAVRDSVMRSLYLPARVNGVPVASQFGTFYNFTVKYATIKDYGDLDRRVRDTKLKAEAGDPSAEMLYGMMIEGLPQLKQKYSQALPWFLKAAQAGAPYAQYQIGTALLNGHGCECDNNKGEIWLQKAAQADQADAQVSLAEYLLKDQSNKEAFSGAIVWLERAAKQNNHTAMLLLSAQLAASPDAKIRDPERALKLTEALQKDFRHDPTLWEIRAAAYAAHHDYDSAIKTELRAKAEAKTFGWDEKQMEERSALYAARQPWTGNLLDF